MVSLRASALLLLLLTPLRVLGDVEFTGPVAGASLPGGGVVQVSWKDSGNAPSIADLKSFQLFLCAGGNDNPIQLLSLMDPGAFSMGNVVAGAVPVALGASVPANAYFLKMISVATVGGTVINYSKRFSLTGMTGVFPAAVLDGMAAVTGTDGPPTVNQVAGLNPAPAAADGPYAVPYNMQTGPTRYAPMQPLPSTKMATKKPTPLWPTSSVSIAKTWLPPPSQVTTVTQAATYSFASHENTASPAAQPSDDMGKFLARWKD
ncbi:MAG: hypothetical protein M1826_003116 [Phylliscum demangeonii]|nr:MAG: hypothetical protein M1826_003116 [Phylliscum demangeonii]